MPEIVIIFINYEIWIIVTSDTTIDYNKNIDIGRNINIDNDVILDNSTINNTNIGVYMEENKQNKFYNHFRSTNTTTVTNSNIKIGTKNIYSTDKNKFYNQFQNTQNNIPHKSHAVVTVFKDKKNKNTFRTNIKTKDSVEINSNSGIYIGNRRY